MPISLTPSPDPAQRRAVRLLAMVGEAHKAGYQRLRICAGVSHGAGAWRCMLSPASNMFEDGWYPRGSNHTHFYSVDQGNRYFDWDDAASDDARHLAAKFIERFPETARAAEGVDLEYAGWFTTTLGKAERGTLPAFYNGLGIAQPRDVIWPPALPRDVVPIDMDFAPIRSERLQPNDLPPMGAPYGSIFPFCLSFDGYVWSQLAGIDLEGLAGAVEQRGYSGTLDELRATAFYFQRREKWAASNWEGQKFIIKVGAAVEAIRRWLGQRAL